MAEITIKEMQQDDWNAVRDIYQAGIATGNATFQTVVPEWDEWNAGHLTDCRYVACVHDELIGWAALSAYSSRHAYRGVAELSIYVHPKNHKDGVGKQLLSALITASEQAGYWTLIAGIFPENQASIRLHLGQGFREVGYREKVGEMNGVFRDVIIFEKRSGKVSSG